MKQHFTDGKLDPQSQCARVLAAVRRQGGVTSWELARSGILGYTARIRDLRELGYPIVTTMEKVKNQYGKTVKRGRFTLLTQTRG